MPSVEEYDSDCDYDARPEAGRIKRHLDSDESDNERQAGSRRPPPFLNDDGDDDDEIPMVLDSNQQHEHDRSSSPSSAAPATAIVNPIRQPTAFAAPNPTTSSGPTFYYKDKTKTPIHAAMSADGTSVFCVEGYVNTPELSAGRGGGLSQGLPATGPYKSLFRAGSKSESHSSASASSHPKTNAAAAVAAAPALHVLAEAAQSPEALSPVSATASPKPAPTCTPAPVPSPTSVPISKKRTRKPSPLIASMSPTSPVARPSPIASTNASSSSSSSQSHIIIDSSPPPRHPRTKSAVAGGSITGKGKQRESHPPVPLEAPGDGNGDGEGSEQRYERGLLILSSGRQLSERPGTQLRDPESPVQDCFRNVQKNKNEAESSKKVGSPPQAPPTPAVHSYEGDYFPFHFEAGPSGTGDIACEGRRSSPSQDIVNHYPTSARATTSKESSLALNTDSRSVTPGTKPRMVTLLIEDRRHGTDELAEVHVLLKTVGEGCLWADAKDVCAALQSGPSRIDGPAKVFTMRGKYRQIFLRVSADGEETTQSANLKVETNRTLPIVVEGISNPHIVMSSLVDTGPGAPVMNTVHPLTPVSNHLGLDGIHTTPSEMGRWSGIARKRKREASLNRVRQLPFGSPATRSIPTIYGQYCDRPRKSRRNNPISSDDDGHMSDSPLAANRSQRVHQRREQTHSGSFLDRSGYETDQPSPSVVVRARPGSSFSDRKMSSLLQPPPAPENSQRMHDKVASFLRDIFMEDALDWNEFCRDRAHVGSLSNVTLLRIYWFAQGRLDIWVGSRLPKYLNNKKVEIEHVLDALGVTDDWYRECNETLSLVIAYGERGERWESPRAVAACRDRAPPKSRHPNHDTGSLGGPSDLLVLLREIHEEYCERIRGSSGKGRASSIEST